MPGQMPTGQFDVTKLEIREANPPAAVVHNIVDVNEAFELIATFEGSGTAWKTMRYKRARDRACFYAEGLGLQAAEVDFGCDTGELRGNKNEYTASIRVSGGISTRGIYKIAVTVEFPGWYGTVGYRDDVLLQVSHWED